MTDKTQNIKTPNYSFADEAFIREAAEANGGKLDRAAIVALSEKLTPARKIISLRAKVVSMGLYQAETVVKKTVKDDGPSKKERLAQLAALGVNPTGFDGVTKAALADLIEKLTNLSAYQNKAA